MDDHGLTRGSSPRVDSAGTTRCCSYLPWLLRLPCVANNGSGFFNVTTLLVLPHTPRYFLPFLNHLTDLPHTNIPLHLTRLIYNIYARQPVVPTLWTLDYNKPHARWFGSYLLQYRRTLPTNAVPFVTPRIAAPYLRTAGGLPQPVQRGSRLLALTAILPVHCVTGSLYTTFYGSLPATAADHRAIPSSTGPYYSLLVHYRSPAI